MSLPHAMPGEVITILPHQHTDESSQALILGTQLEVLRTSLKAGHILAQHRLKEEGTLQCLSGALKVEVEGEIQMMQAGDLICLPKMESYSLMIEEDSVLLLTLLRPPKN